VPVKNIIFLSLTLHTSESEIPGALLKKQRASMKDDVNLNVTMLPLNIGRKMVLKRVWLLV
jgi:hypothetical protein